MVRGTHPTRSTVKNFKSLFLLVLLLMVVACGESKAPVTDRLVVGEPFPEVELHSIEGGVTPLAAYRGRLVVLNIWATWCAACRLEMPALQALSETLDPQRFALLGLSVDEDAHLAREYLLEKKVTFARYIDPDHQLINETFGVTLFPYTFLIAADGTLIGRVVGAREWQGGEVVEWLERLYVESTVDALGGSQSEPFTR